MKHIYNMIKIIYGSIIAWTFFVVMFCSLYFKISSENEFLLPNLVYLLMGLLVLGGWIRFTKDKSFKKREITTKHIIVISIVLGIVQFILNYNRFFYCSWDAGIVLSTVSNELSGNLEEIREDYFSVFSNNLFISAIFTMVARLFSVFKIPEETSMLFFNHVTNVLAAIFLYLLSMKAFANQKLALWIYAVYQGFVGFSPWFIVSYSDQITICLPVILLYLAYVLAEKRHKPITFLFGFLIGFLALIGFYLKPQILICFIAICLFGGCKVIQNWKSIQFMEIVRPVLAAVLGLMISWFVVNQCIVPTLHINIDKERTFGPLHFVMMGLNQVNHGGYVEEDTVFSNSFGSKKEREDAQKQEIVRRVKEYGFVGMVSHLTQKQLSTFGDGSFYWYGEGEMFIGKPIWNSDPYNLFLYDWIRRGKQFYNIFLTYCQVIWMLLLAGVFMGATVFGKEKNDLELMIIINLIGFMLFQIIFETRGRYVFCYSPLYILMGVRGLYITYYRYIDALVKGKNKKAEIKE